MKWFDNYFLKMTDKSPNYYIEILNKLNNYTYISVALSLLEEIDDDFTKRCISYYIRFNEFRKKHINDDIEFIKLPKEYKLFYNAIDTGDVKTVKYYIKKGKLDKKWRYR